MLLALLAAASAVILFVTLLALRGVLVEQLDNRLEDASRRWPRPPAMLPGYSQQAPEGGAGAGPGAAAPTTADRPDPVLLRFQAPGTLGAIIELRRPVLPSPAGPETPPGTLDGNLDEDLIEQVTVAVTESGSLITLTGADAATVAAVPPDGVSHTRTIGDRGDYRLIAAVTQDGSAIIVTGLPMDEVGATLTRTAAIGAVVAAFGVLAAAVAGASIIRVTMRPLNRVAATAARVAELPLHRGAVDLPALGADIDTDPRTEVGQVGAALDRMLGHIGAAFAARHASETRMRQFLADASHELRTPLAAISGYAELTRRTRDTVPPDIVYAMGRVESESARMTALVSDLLLLARLDSGRPLERESVDLSRLVVDAVSDAHVAAPTHRFALDLPGKPVTTVGDPARLHQVLANLLANTRSHTPPGTRVTARLSTQAHPARPRAFITAGPVPGGAAAGPVPNGAAAGPPAIGPTPIVWSAVLQIIDDGPGIPPELLPRVFERFARGDSSRSRAAGSTGLGLSIVAAVVEAHHGQVDVASRPGQTVFTVCLPMAAAHGSHHEAAGEPEAEPARDPEPVPNPAHSTRTGGP